MLLKDYLYNIHKQGKAVLAANFYNLETLKGILSAAKHTGKPIILQASEGTVDFIGLDILVKTVRAAIKYYGVRAWLHLDHGKAMDIIRRVLDAGFDSVMIDASTKDFYQNVEITQQVVELARPYGVNVEAELGYVPKPGETRLEYEYTKPEDAELFVRMTGINALAIAVGTVHGFYKKRPRINYRRIKEIRERVDIPLVLHGSSGLSNDQLRKSVEAGISKINLATEVKHSFTQALRQSLNDSSLDPREYLPHTIRAVSFLVRKKQQIITK